MPTDSPPARMEEEGEEERYEDARDSEMSLGDEEEAIAASANLFNASPKSIANKRTSNNNNKRWLEFPPALRPSKFSGRHRVRFEKLSPDGENSEEEDEDEMNPLKVSAIICGVPILTEREADYRLSTKVEEWKKFFFLASNLPYVALALVALSLEEIKHHAYHPALDEICASSLLHAALAALVSLTSFALHVSQVRVGHWCCSSANARTCHRRRVQDRFDLADCTCASLAVILAVFCHGIQQMGTQMLVVVPIFAASIVAKKLKWWNLYLVLHSVWHLATAYLLWFIFFPPDAIATTGANNL